MRRTTTIMSIAIVVMCLVGFSAALGFWVLSAIVSGQQD